MKKLLAIAIASISVAAMAVDPVGYSPKVGVTEITATLQNTIVPVKFSSLVDASNIKAKDLVHPQGIPENTQLYVFVNNGDNNTYMSFLMNDSNEWIALNAASTVSGFIPADQNQVAVVGSALWLVFPSNTDLTNKKVYIFGQVEDSLTSTIVPGKSNLLCNPTTETVTGSSLISKLDGKATRGDTISPLGASFAGNYIYNGTIWMHVYQEAGSMVIDQGPNNAGTLPDVLSNQGFWYVSKAQAGGENKTIEW